MPINKHLHGLIVSLARSDSKAVYKEIFEILFPQVKNFVQGIVKSPDLAEEIASDVLFMIWTQRSQMVAVKNPKYYAFVAAKNRALNEINKGKGSRLVYLNDIDFDIALQKSSPEAIFIHGEMVDKLQKSIDSLPKQCKTVFKLVREEGFSYQEVADMLEISPKTVAAHLMHATERLTKLLKNEFRFV